MMMVWRTQTQTTPDQTTMLAQKGPFQFPLLPCRLVAALTELRWHKTKAHAYVTPMGEGLAG